MAAVEVDGVKQHVRIDDDHDPSPTLCKPPRQRLVLERPGEAQRLDEIHTRPPQRSRCRVPAGSARGGSKPARIASLIASVNDSPRSRI
jgi:hypothetical protein